ncbi:MAG: D-alanine--D-alanine ligase [Alphaproteobacteria bacterium]|nr:MAG: hypothetical protein B6I23_02780 [Rickettsiaceae bacterium 4572_127]
MKKICILKGGSAEREVSLMSAREISQALREKGYEVFEHDYQAVQPFLDFLKTEKIDVVFNALHGGEGEDGRISALLDLIKIPYTHSGHTACAIAMDKLKTKFVADELGIKMAESFEMENPKNISTLPSYPMVVKPIDEGSSVGVYIIKTKQEWLETKDILDINKKWMAEEFIPGRELTTAVVFDEALSVTELIPSVEFYDYKAKYTDGITKHTLPAKIPDEIFQKCKKWALEIHKALGCRQTSRSDFRYDEEKNNLVFLELNTHPGMTKLSLLPEQVMHEKKCSYGDFCESLIKDALKRF